MEKFQIYREEASRRIKTADHMLTMSYPLLKDPKILLSVANNLLLSAENAMTSVLEYERLFKRIPPFNDSFDSKFNLFKQKIMPKHEFNKKNVKAINDLKELMRAHKESAVEFSRNNKFVMATDNYELRTLTEADLKKYVVLIRNFIEETNTVTQKDEGIFR